MLAWTLLWTALAGPPTTPTTQELGRACVGVPAEEPGRREAWIAVGLQQGPVTTWVRRDHSFEAGDRLVLGICGETAGAWWAYASLPDTTLKDLFPGPERGTNHVPARTFTALPQASSVAWPAAADAITLVLRWTSGAEPTHLPLTGYTLQGSAGDLLVHLVLDELDAGEEAGGALRLGRPD